MSLKDARNARKLKQLEVKPSWSVSIDKQEAHKSSVTALATQDDRLFSAALKSVKIWDIGSMH